MANEVQRNHAASQNENYLFGMGIHFLEWENISGVRSFDFYVMFTITT